MMAEGPPSWPIIHLLLARSRRPVSRSRFDRAARIGIVNGSGCFLEKVSAAKNIVASLPDDFEHEIVTNFVLKGQGLVVLTFAVTVASSIRSNSTSASGIQKVHAVIGGFHIVPPLTDEYIRQVIAAFKEINPDYLIPGHCAGERFYDIVRAEMPEPGMFAPRSERASSSECKSFLAGKLPHFSSVPTSFFFSSSWIQIMSSAQDRRPAPRQAQPAQSACVSFRRCIMTRGRSVGRRKPMFRHETARVHHPSSVAQQRGGRSAHAQQPVKIRRIGYLDYGAGISPSGGFAPFHDTYRRRPFLEGLRERGWVEGQTLPSSDGLRRARQIGSLHLPPNSLPSTST